MCKRTSTVLFAVAACCAVPARAADIYVPGDYSTIQAAVNAASPGDTIYVAAGTYNEQVNVTKSLTILGAGATSTFVDSGTGNYMAYSVINVDDVTIKGFSITCDAIGQAVWLDTCSNCVIEDNIVHDVSSGTGIRVVANFGSYSGIVIRGNTVRDNLLGITLNISGGDVAGGETAADILIEGNTCYNNANAIGLESSYGGVLQDVTVTDNTLYNQASVNIFSRSWRYYNFPPDVPTGPWGTFSNVNITGNDITGFRGVKFGLAYCSNNGYMDGESDVTGFHVSCNSIVPSGTPEYLASNVGLGALDAENNWWGQDPPDSGLFVGNVDYDPWLSAGTPTVTLHADDECYAVGETVAVTMHLSGIIEPITGGQFFLAWDSAKLTFVSATAISPFMELHETSDAGTLDYAVYINPPDAFCGEGDFATLFFTAQQTICTESDLITWPVNEPPTTLSDGQGNPIYPVLVALDVIDDEPPVIDCPTDVTVECDESTDPADTGQAGATDNCDPNAAITYSDVADMSGCGGYTGTITRTWEAEDYCGNISTCAQIITVVDTTPPVITCPSDVGVQCITDIPAADFAGGTVSDNCDPSPTVTHVSDVSDGNTCPETITRTYRATDACDNWAECTQTITVDDTIPPTVTDCPDDISVNADAGVCTAQVNWTAPTVTDNCDASPTVAYDIDEGDDGSVEASISTTTYTFPGGTSRVTVVATDVCGNVNDTCDFTVTVSDYNELVVGVELQNVNEPTLTRCITFELWECGTPSSVVVEEEITFTNGIATGASVLVPCGSYECITARDRLHTLRRTDDDGDFAISGTQYVADFTSGGATDDSLIGGNLNDDFWIDILDFGVFSWQWGACYGSGCPTDPNGDTDCSTPFPHADINGDGLVTTADFTFIQINFLQSHEANCCGEPGMLRSEGPITRISVEELEAMGLPELAVGDLNGDGWLDEQDVVAFFNGARPGEDPDTVPPAELEPSVVPARPMSPRSR